jgi:hypothetical protein
VNCAATSHQPQTHPVVVESLSVRDDDDDEVVELTVY